MMVWDAENQNENDRNACEFGLTLQLRIVEFTAGLQHH